MKSAHTGLARRILTLLEAKPDQTVYEIAQALNEKPRSCMQSLGTLATDSKVKRTGTRKSPKSHHLCVTYGLTKLGRDVLAKVQPSVMPQVVPPSQVPKSIPAQTVEQFEANGGKIQRLPTSWTPPTRYPRVGGIS